MKKTMKIIGLLVLIPVVLFVLFVLFSVAADFRPPEETILEVKAGNEIETLTVGNTFTLMTFNIGYCGLDKGQDFFMDGGEMSRSRSKEQTLANCEGVLRFIKDQDPQILLIQEIDEKASRSWKVNELERFRDAFPGKNNLFAYNYKVPWVPVPVNRPMGSVKSGLATFLNFPVSKARRLRLPGKEDFPKQLFVLDRCLLETEIPVSQNKTLLLVNLHLSAYDKGGKVRKYQLNYVKDYLENKYDENTYIILGGDWNHLLSPRQLANKKPHDVWPGWLVLLPDNFTPEGYNWVVDEDVWTCRDNDTPYEKGKNFVTVIDGFLISDNIEVVSFTGHDLGFTNSDHNPVSCILRLKDQ